jgi:hypothetical protein
MDCDEKHLDLIKNEVLSDLQSLVSRLDCRRLSAFNRGYLSYLEDPFSKFVLDEKSGWDRIVGFYAFERGDTCKGILDVGTFIPYYPAVLKKWGYQVEVIEKMSLYGEGYEPIIDYLDKQEIKIHNIDIINDPIDALPKGYDVLLIALLEHLNGSPRPLIEKIKTLMDEDSLLYIGVPNICKLQNIIRMLRGKSPLPSYHNYFFSSYPFEGHNREMTLKELCLLCRFSSLKVTRK